jgi:BMFP domain-containing protein YqiC
MDVVKREEFEAVREMAVKAREENERLARRIAELESRLPAAEALPSGNGADI